MSSHFSVLFLNLLCANYDKKKTESRRNTCFPLITAHRGLSVRGWTHKPTSAQDFNFSLQTPVSVGVSQELFCVFIAIFLQVKTRCPGLCKLLIDHSFLSFCFAKMCVCFSLFGFVSILAASVHFPALQSPSKYVAALSGPCFVVRTWACRRSKPAPEYISYHPPPFHTAAQCAALTEPSREKSFSCREAQTELCRQMEKHWSGDLTRVQQRNRSSSMKLIYSLLYAGSMWTHMLPAGWNKSVCGVNIEGGGPAVFLHSSVLQLWMHRQDGRWEDGGFFQPFTSWSEKLFHNKTEIS